MHDAHIHLYGALTGEDLWEEGLENIDSLKLRMDRFKIYQEHYECHVGQRPVFYWPFHKTSLLEDYSLQKPCSFQAFEGRFLLIAFLCPIFPSSTHIPLKMIQRWEREKMDFVEPRIILPSYFGKNEAFEYFHTLENLKKDTLLRIRWVLSFPRNLKLASQHWLWWKEWAHIHKKQDWAFDFHGDEEQGENIFSLLGELLKDLGPERVYCHVGEVFSDPYESTRHLTKLLQMGIKRLGHALVLIWKPAENFWMKEKLEKQKLWWIENKNFCEQYGFPLKKTLALDFEEIWDLWQKALLTCCRENSVSVEVCPTSNSRLGPSPQIPPKKIAQLWKNTGVSLLIGTDDPGILRTDFLREKSYFQ